MYEKFGEFGSADELNELALNLRSEGDKESLMALAKENGIDSGIAEICFLGEIDFICDDTSAAIGKIDVEAKELKAQEIQQDWIEYIKAKCIEDTEIAKAVRKKGKTLTGAIAELLKWGFANQVEVDKDILKAAGVKAARVTLGIPGIGTAKILITKYYLGGDK